MGTDFNFGWNDKANNLAPWGAGTVEGQTTGPGGTIRRNLGVEGADPGPVSDELLEITCAEVKKMLHNITVTVRKANRQPMDLSSYKSSNGSGGTKFENRDWIEVDHLPKKGSAKWKIDSFRPATKKGSKAIGFVDLSSGSKKRVMSLRKGFTLDAFIEELGTNTDKWKGKTINLERGGSEGQYVNVSQ